MTTHGTSSLKILNLVRRTSERWRGVTDARLAKQLTRRRQHPLVSLLNFMKTHELTKWLRENSSGVYRPAAEAADLIERLQKLSSALLEDLQHRVEDRADSSLPEWEDEARRLGILANDQRNGAADSGPPQQ